MSNPSPSSVAFPRMAVSTSRFTSSIFTPGKNPTLTSNSHLLGTELAQFPPDILPRLKFTGWSIPRYAGWASPLGSLYFASSDLRES